MADNNAMYVLEECASNEIQNKGTDSEDRQSDKGVDSVTACNMERVGGFVIELFQREKTNMTHALAGTSDYSRKEFLCGACTKEIHSEKNNKSLSDQEVESSSCHMPSKAMSEEILSQEKGKEPETTAAVEFGDVLVNRRITVFWPGPGNKAFIEGTITSFDPVNKKHTVTYDDDNVEVLNLMEGKKKVFGDRTTHEFVQSCNEEANHPPSAKESLKRPDEMEKGTASLKEKHLDTELTDSKVVRKDDIVYTRRKRIDTELTDRKVVRKDDIVYTRRKRKHQN